MPCAPDTARPTDAAARQAGFTLVEVMAAGVILSVLALGLAHMWAAVGAQSIDLTVRQKAVLVLNGEMERLSSLYFFTGFGAITSTDTSGYDTPTGFVDDRVIYRSATNAFMATGGDAFVVDQATFLAGADSLVLLQDAVGTSDDRNFVWIDRERNIVGRLSWVEEDVAKQRTCDGQDCFCFDWAGGPGGTECREVTLYLEFPFRMTETGPEEMDQPILIMPLKTVVGRWR